MRRSHIAVVTTDDLDSTVREFLDYCRTKNLSPHTLGYYRDRLGQFTRFCHDRLSVADTALLTPLHIGTFITETLDAGYSAKTVNHTLKATKALCNYLIDEGRLEVSPMARIKPLRMEQKIIQTLSDDQIRQMLGQCDHKTFAGIRDYAIILTLLDTGLRVSELSGLKTTDIDWSSALMKVLGKGSKERLVPFGSSLRRALREYLKRKGEDNGTPYIFLSQYGSPLDRGVIRVLLRNIAKEAEVSGVRVSPHTFRHTFAKNWVLNGGDPFSLQAILGHTTQHMVSQYAIRNPRTTRASTGLYHAGTQNLAA